jgi:hypothetical protein
VLQNGAVVVENPRRTQAEADGLTDAPLRVLVPADLRQQNAEIVQRARVGRTPKQECIEKMLGLGKTSRLG